MTPLLAYAFGALVGAAVGAVAGTSGNAVAWIVLPLGSAVFVRRRLLLQTIGVAAIAVVLAWSVGALHHASTDELTQLAARAPRCSFGGVVQESFGSTGAVVAGSFRCNGGALGSGRTYVGLGAAPGARVEGDGWLLPLGDDSPFDSMRRRAGLTTEFHVESRRIEAPSGPLRFAETFRTSLRHALSDDARGALALGLSIGDTSGISSSDLETLRAAGLTHLVAVSGSNVAIVLGSVALMLRWTARRTRLVAAALALSLYVLVVGPEPSVLRAAAMGAIGLAAIASGTRGDPLVALLLAVTVLLVLRPSLVWSLGLQLSAAATAGIVLWSARIERSLVALPGVVRLPLAVTLAAQMSVAPILVASVGALSLVAPLANVLAVPVVAPATILALTAGVIAPALPWLGALVGTGAEMLCGWILWVGRTTGAVPWAELTVTPGWALPLAAAALAAGSAPGRRD